MCSHRSLPPRATGATLSYDFNARSVICWTGESFQYTLRQRGREMNKVGSKTSALTDMAESSRLLIQSITDDAMIVLDRGGRVVTWNPGAERIHGASAAEMIGQHFSSFYLPADVATGNSQADLELAEKERCAETEAWRLRKDGSRFWAL